MPFSASSVEGGEGFPTTRWSSLLKLKDPSRPGYRSTLEALIASYWKPVYLYFRRAWNRNAEDGRDLTQEFFSRILEKPVWDRISPERGSFRSFLRAMLKHFMLNVRDHERVRLPRNGRRLLQFEEAESTLERWAPGTPGKGPEEIFDEAWSRTLIEESIQALEKTLVDRGKLRYLEVFRLYHYGDSGAPQPTYDEIATRLGIKTGDVRNYLSFARAELKRLLRERIKDYAEPNQLDEELRFLLG